MVVADGHAVRRAQIRAAPTRGRETVVYTDDAGRYSVSLPVGEYSLSASKAGLVSLQLGQRWPFESPSLLQLSDRQTATVADFALSPGGVIEGTVSDDDRLPVADAVVGLYQETFNRGDVVIDSLAAVGPVRTDDHGRFRLHSVPDGKFYVGVTLGGAFGEEPNRYAYPQTYYPSATSGEGVMPVSVRSGDSVVRNISLKRHQLLNIEGIVVQSDGRPVAEGLIRWSSLDDPFVPSKIVPVGEGGRFSVQTFDFAGSFMISAQIGRLGHLAEAEFASARVRRDPNIPQSRVRLTSRAGVNLRVSLAPNSAFRKDVVISCTPVRLDDAWLGRRMVMFSSSGVGALRNIHRPCLLDVEVGGQQWPFSATINDQPVEDLPIDPARVGNSEIRIALREPSTIRGLAVPASKAKSIVIARLDPSSWSDPRRRAIRVVKVGPEGKFEVRGLPDGDYFAAAVSQIDTRRISDTSLMRHLASTGLVFAIRDSRAPSLRIRKLSE
jgi:hypothetical protein